MKSLNELTPFVLIMLLIGILLAVGLTTLNVLQKTTATATTTTSKVAWNSTGTNFTITNLKSVTSITNTTGSTLGTGNYSVTASDGERDSTGFITILKNQTGIGGCTQGGGPNNCTITYIYNNFDSEASTAANKTMDAVSEIPNNWLLIIAVVFIASYLIYLIISAFKTEGR